jgi:type II secretory pathway pseudopilin PulG
MTTHATPEAGLPPGGRSGRTSAFTLLELMGTLAVITILLLALLPALFRESERLARGAETKALRAIADGLMDYVQTARRIPGTNTFAADVAGQLGWLPGAVRATARGHDRCFLVDPGFRVGSPAAAPPYVQGTNGSVIPVRPRLMLVSTMASPLPTNITVGAASNTNVFDQVWGSSEGTAPAGWTGGGNWEDYLVQRINLEALFIPLVLNNNSPTLGRYSVDATNNHVALPSNPFGTYFLVGTALGLHDSAGNMQARLVIQDTPQVTNSSPSFLSQSYVFEKGVWRGKIFMTTDGQKHNGVDLQSAYEIFMSGPANVYKVGSVTQTTLTQKMYEFMSNYVVWASNGFPAGGKAAVTASQSAMASQVSTYCNKKATTY